eukprot:TRINITY_DN25504_c0_g1_i2.p1 TRINITY_DN25504_c0_g1~~TRINITY_DN25504_c0_g1_i2.p1  ORF type:complete len:159 (+),score=45.99 TRINITY_DN25504_c0_g1_i2:3-479(+)
MGELKGSYGTFVEMARKKVTGGERQQAAAVEEQEGDVGVTSEAVAAPTLTPLHALLLFPLFFAIHLITTYSSTASLISDYSSIASAFNDVLQCAQTPQCDPTTPTATLQTLLDTLGPSHPYYLASAPAVIVAAQFTILVCDLLLMIVSGLAVYWFLKQ